MSKEGGLTCNMQEFVLNLRSGSHDGGNIAIFLLQRQYHMEGSKHSYDFSVVPSEVSAFSS